MQLYPSWSARDNYVRNSFLYFEFISVHNVGIIKQNFNCVFNILKAAVSY